MSPYSYVYGAEDAPQLRLDPSSSRDRLIPLGQSFDRPEDAPQLRLDSSYSLDQRAPTDSDEPLFEHQFPSFSQPDGLLDSLHQGLQDEDCPLLDLSKVDPKLLDDAFVEQILIMSNMDYSGHHASSSLNLDSSQIPALPMPPPSPSPSSNPAALACSSSPTSDPSDLTRSLSTPTVSSTPNVSSTPTILTSPTPIAFFSPPRMSPSPSPSPPGTSSSPPPASAVASSASILVENAAHQLEKISPIQDDLLGPTPTFVDPLARQPTTHAERNPLLPIQPVEERSENSKRKLTEAQLATRKIAREDRRKIEKQLNEDVIDLAGDIDKLVQAVADKNKVAKDVVRDRLSNFDRLKKSKACGRMQALVRLKGLQVNPDRPTGEKLKAHQLLQLVKEDPEMLALSGPELDNAMKGAEIAQLLKLKGARANNRAAGRDYTSTCDKLTEAFDNVHLRTGAIGFGFLVTPTHDDEGEPTFFIAGPDTPEFVRQYLHMEMWDMLNKAELWASDRAKGNHRDTRQMREDCLSMIASGLQYIVGSRKKVRMNYDNYDSAIVQKHSVQLIGLPEGMPKLTKPTSHNVPAHVARELYGKLQAGTCRWVRMNNEELAAHHAAMDDAATAGKPVGKPRAGRSDKGKKRSTYAGRPTQKSGDGIEKESENDEEDSGGEGAGEPSQKRQKTQQPAKAAPKPKKKTKGNGTSKRVLRQLPPRPRSKSTIGDETDAEASAS
ncbi:hypothetical protein PQX77_012935 [Marasmius sp. AFHP31]|nr:hypothetical protein PQX77_012935 [Marasmius sp. AFHP31]